MNRDKTQFTWRSLAFILAGVVVATFSQVCFLIPNRIVPSGLTGVGTVLFARFGFPIGVFLLLCNAGLIGLQARLFGFRSSGKTIVAIVLQSVLLDLCTSVWRVPTLATDPMLAAIYGGLLTGLGIALLFRGGGTLGGTDILAQILLKYKHIPAGTTFLGSDVSVLLLAAGVFGPDRALYAMIKSYGVSQTVDYFMEGSSVQRQVFVVSKHSDEIAWGIMEELHRGCTLLAGRGAYTNRPVEVLMTAVRRREVPMLEELIYRLDPNAFIMISEARRVLGKGFDNLEDDIDLESLPVEPELGPDGLPVRRRFGGKDATGATGHIAPPGASPT